MQILWHFLLCPMLRRNQLPALFPISAILVMARSTTSSPNSQIAPSRSDASYEKDYLLGKYGATPIIEDLSKALNYESKV